MEELKKSTVAQDEVIVVTLPRKDYDIMRKLIDDRKSTDHFVGKWKSFLLTLSAVVASWFFLGETFIATLKKYLVE